MLPPAPARTADVVAEGRLLLIVANKLDALSAAQREQALGLVRRTVEDSLPDVRCACWGGWCRWSRAATRLRPLNSSAARSADVHAATLPCARPAPTPTPQRRAGHRHVCSDGQGRGAAAAGGPVDVRALESAGTHRQAQPLDRAGALRGGRRGMWLPMHLLVCIC